ncbi:hypothetical protein SAMN04489725_10729 [Alicyclobacillus hesperidum]|uniref:Uncharacterized protein n=1 Tax=Alicyclobacillus hesperidum TaxID=89784 RepID=A0A1H2U343_9BACL|nr:hypothetical protein SAMN04489725_10729 [Alicyclobacillus hesperidum]
MFMNYWPTFVGQGLVTPLFACLSIAALAKKCQCYLERIALDGYMAM